MIAAGIDFENDDVSTDMNVDTTPEQDLSQTTLSKPTISNPSTPPTENSTKTPIMPPASNTSTPSNTSSKSNNMTRADMKDEVLKFAKQLGYNMPPDFSKHMSDEQLQQEFTKFRSLAQKTNVTNKDKSLRKGLDQMTPAERLAQNLNGVNTSTLDATQLKIFP